MKLLSEMAEHFPESRIAAVSNSKPQRKFIQSKADERNLGNLQVITADMNDFNIDRQFDRIVSVEMFEHMRNWQRLLERISLWMKPQARLFIHIFTIAGWPMRLRKTVTTTGWAAISSAAG